MLSRKAFCLTSGASLLLPESFYPASVQATTQERGILITILLSGGNDGLNTVVPLSQYGQYTDLRRPSTAPPELGLSLNIPLAELSATAFEHNYSVPASKSATYAFHPRMTALRTLYGAGKVAVINGVGIPPQDTNRLSHQAGQYDWQTGTINRNGLLASGWLGQAFAATPNGTLPPMLSLSGQVPLVMQGRSSAVLAVNVPLESFNLFYATLSSKESGIRDGQFVSIDKLSTGTVAGELLRAASNSASDLVTVIQAVAGRESCSDYPPTTSYLGQQLLQIARVILSGSGVRSYYAVQGGYDTHSSQQNVQPGLLEDLSESIAAFYTYLRAKGASSNVALMTFSDFGRRAAGNSTFGTDHGTGSVALVIGDPVKGGTYGSYPNLKDLDDDGNVKVEVDFRNQISDVLTFIDADAATILGRTYPKLGFI